MVNFPAGPFLWVVMYLLRKKRQSVEWRAINGEDCNMNLGRSEFAAAAEPVAAAGAVAVPAAPT
jgi:hypothetical protein